ncbi:hypothetical protein KS4_06620 [Poriferisphaera corsica]|uniref:Uncharacterized protein n=1 Tax=Poriferisphaera corsica TaxID=2528020 RepID=A0A517YQW8_9BACT|nr:hypothetical protein KS4_06620 [Poriferisphaera corsica]
MGYGYGWIGHAKLFTKNCEAAKVSIARANHAEQSGGLMRIVWVLHAKVCGRQGQVGHWDVISMRRIDWDFEKQGA